MNARNGRVRANIAATAAASNAGRGSCRLSIRPDTGRRCESPAVARPSVTLRTSVSVDRMDGMSRTMNTSPATPATRVLDRLGVTYTPLPYEHDPNVTAYGAEAATALGLDPSTVFKTLVIHLDSGRFAMACVPVATTCDLKAAAAACGAKKASLAAEADVRRLTGYVLGGVSPLGTRSRLDVVLDSGVLVHDEVCVSGGRRGFDVRLAPDDLVRVCDARVAEIAAH